MEKAWLQASRDYVSVDAPSLQGRSEHLWVARNAAHRGDHHAAIVCLLAGVQERPRDADLAQALGQEYAVLRQFDHAEREFFRALNLDPMLHTARCQLGWGYLVAGHPDLALAVWSAFSILAKDEILKLFRIALPPLLANDSLAMAMRYMARIAERGFSPAAYDETDRLMMKVRHLMHRRTFRRSEIIFPMNNKSA